MCHFSEKSPKFYKKLSSKPVVLCRVLLGENTVASSIKRLGSPMYMLVTIVQIRRVRVDQTSGGKCRASH